MQTKLEDLDIEAEDYILEDGIEKMLDKKHNKKVDEEGNL